MRAGTTAHLRPGAALPAELLNPMASLRETYSEGGCFESRLPYDQARERLWRVLCGYLEKDFRRNAAVLEIGGAYCHFINNVKAAKHQPRHGPPQSRGFSH